MDRQAFDAHQALIAGTWQNRQGRAHEWTNPSKREDGTTRDTMPGELLPNPPDPAQGVSGWAVWLGVGTAVLALVGAWHGIALVLEKAQ